MLATAKLATAKGILRWLGRGEQDYEFDLPVARCLAFGKNPLRMTVGLTIEKPWARSETGPSNEWLSSKQAQGRPAGTPRNENSRTRSAHSRVLRKDRPERYGRLFSSQSCECHPEARRRSFAEPHGAAPVTWCKIYLYRALRVTWSKTTKPSASGRSRLCLQPL